MVRSYCTEAASVSEPSSRVRSMMSLKSLLLDDEDDDEEEDICLRV
jgi:hypothetical protein